jgi:hypothetical protein
MCLRQTIAKQGDKLMNRHTFNGLSILIIMAIGVLVASNVDAQDGVFEIDPNNFDPVNSINIDNQWLPMRPGTQLVYEGDALEDDEEVERGVIFTVTDLTKEIMGINTVVVWERDFNDGELIESELAFFAQDNDGNIWHLGQYRETYDEDEFVGGRVWLVDLPEGAKAGIFMWAEPVVGEESYSQGFAPEPFNWTDRAQVIEMGQDICTELDCYEDVLVIEESDDEEPEGAQLKLYAPGVGLIKVDFSGDDPEQEVMELVEIIELGPDELEEVREEALVLETHAFMYAQTSPVQPR